MERHIRVKGLDLKQYHSLVDVLEYPLNFCEDFSDPLVKLVSVEPYHEKVGEEFPFGKTKHDVVLVAGEESFLESHETKAAINNITTTNKISFLIFSPFLIMSYVP